MSADGLSHFLLTRFNTRLSDDTPPPPEAWLRSRLKLFDQYALPSVAQQDVPPDSWLIFCDAGSPTWFREQFPDRIPVWAEPVWLDRPFSTDEAAAAVAARVRTPWVITTRMDNDDCIARDYLGAVRAAFANSREFINFTAGLQCEFGRLYQRLDPSNAFVSLAEPTVDMTTVFIDGHDQVAKHGPLRQVKTPPMWIQIVHGENLANSVHGIRVNPSGMASRFAADLELVNSSHLSLILDRAWTTLRLGLRVISKPHRLKWLIQSVMPGRTKNTHRRVTERSPSAAAGSTDGQADGLAYNSPGMVTPVLRND